MSPSDTTAPYSFVWSGVGTGTYSITARAFDNLGAQRTSAASTVTVVAAPVAATTLYFVHPDHLGTPRVVADAAGVTVWRWDNLEPFGLTGVQTDPDGNGQAFVLNLRFAGQYFDAESGLFHNRHRDYDSASGRYVQADPIGLAGGISLYSYVGANPLGFVDPLGLACEKPGAEAAKRVHKNSLSYVGETHVYRIKGPDGTTHKIGESARGLNAEGASVQAEQQARRLTRETGDVYTSQIRKTFPDKASAREYETRVIERFRSMYGEDKLPGNLTNR